MQAKTGDMLEPHVLNRYAAAAVVTVVAVIATLLPALRATRVDQIVALRPE